MLFTWPNVLTLFRILLIPFFVLLFYIPALSESLRNALACFLFLLAALTDLVDGFLARYLQQTSSLGAFLDPVADKLIVVCALILLVKFYSLEVWITIVISTREIAISALRERAAQVGKRRFVSVHLLGKWKTALQLIAIPLLFMDNYLLFSDISCNFIGSFLIHIAAYLTVFSMIVYFHASAGELFRDK